jgi:hypothetical protein
MVGDPGRLYAVYQRAQLPQVRRVKDIAAADRQRYPVHHQRIVAADSIKVMQGFAPGDQIVLGDDLKPVHRLWRGGKLPKMLATQAEAEALQGFTHGIASSLTLEVPRDRSPPGVPATRGGIEPT